MRSVDAVIFRAVLTAALASTTVPAGQAGQAVSQIRQDVEQSLRDDDDLRRIAVSIAGDEVTLGGSVPHLLAKNRAIERALDIDGVETVVNELTLPEEEDDSELAERVGKAINRYVNYTIWDYIDGVVEGGVVRLFGSVTPDYDKKGDLYKAVAKIRGVQDYVDDIEIQSASITDERLRAVISRRLASSMHFERTARMRTPPFHIVVNNSIVTLIGYVQSEIEYREMEQLIRFTQGVLRVDNQLQVIG